MNHRMFFASFSLILALYHPFCTPVIQQTASPDGAMAQLWERPEDLARADLFWGPWGSNLAPDPAGTYTFVERKLHGTNPGITVKDARGREWHVKQPPHNDQGAEGPIEVTLSRVLSAVGYHQPPVYFLPRVTVKDANGTHQEPGGRFRLSDESLTSLGEWSWQQNPFVGTPPYQGLLVMLMMFNSSDIKNENNVLYEVRQQDERSTHWYVVRDLGTALGETGRLAPQRGDADIFEREPFITGINHGVVQFNYHGWHQELVRHVMPEDVVWASRLLNTLSDEQWTDAFRAGGYDPAIAARFIARLHQKIAEGLRLTDTASFTPVLGMRRP